jgi:uncharacterized membrane protein YjjP (DUF1212 family)
MPQADAQAPYLARVDFVVELARRLHAYGTSANRLEGAVSQVARRLQVEADVWSNPTGMLLSFADVERGAPHSITRVIRLDPGDTNLGRLARVDAIAEVVLAGTRNLAEGLEALRALDRKPRRFSSMLSVLSFGLAAASVTGLLPRMGWADLTTAAILGMLIGVLTEYSATRPRWRDAHEAVAAFVATLAATTVACFIAPLTLQGVIVAALIVLMPGLTLTNAVAELSSQQLVSGTARFAGALTVLLKLTFGAVAGAQVVHLFGWEAMPNAGAVLPAWMPWLTLLAGSFAFAVLFKAARRDTLLVMASVWLGFAVQRLADSIPALQSNAFPTGVFAAGIVVTAVSNAYGRWANRPGALVRVPGIILLVPGSLGFRSFNFAFERDLMLGLDTAFSVVTALIALVAGILVGSLILPSRRNR